MCIIIYTNIYIIPSLCFGMEDEIQREIDMWEQNYASGIVEATAIYENGILECNSPSYNFEISSDYVRAFDKKQEGKEVFYCSRSYSKICQDQALLDGLRAITHMLPELSAGELEKIVGQAVTVVQAGIMNKNSSLNTMFDA